MTPTLGFRLKHRDDLGRGLHQFCLGKHTSTAIKLIKACTYQHQVIAGGGGTPTLEKAAYLTAPDGV